MCCSGAHFPGIVVGNLRWRGFIRDERSGAEVMRLARPRAGGIAQRIDARERSTAAPTLAELGYDATFAAALKARGEDCLPARVARASRGWCWTWTDGGEVVARVPGRLHRLGEVPVVGDFVALEHRGADAVVVAVLPRKTCFVRRAAGRHEREQVIAANVDVALIVMGLDGDYNLRRIERYLALAHESGAQPVIVLNKADLCPEAEARRAEVAALAGSAPVYVVSAHRDEGLAALLPHFGPGATVALLGSSGVGKSTLLNRLVGENRMKTAAVRTSDDRGRHTTTHRELVVLPSGALVIDNPGMRELGLVGDALVADAFDDVSRAAERCRFADCRHQGEPGCAVAEMVARSELSAERVESFTKLRLEIAARARPGRRRR